MSQLVQPTRILIVGGGGREHALAWKLAAEPGVNEVVVAPGSDAIAAEPRVLGALVQGIDPGAIVDVARARAVELVVVGPESWLAAGVVDALTDAGIPVFGPTAAAAQTAQDPRDADRDHRPGQRPGQVRPPRLLVAGHQVRAQ